MVLIAASNKRINIFAHAHLFFGREMNEYCLPLGLVGMITAEPAPVPPTLVQRFLKMFIVKICCLSQFFIRR